MLPLKVRGDKIVDSKGKEVRLRGFCVGGWMNMENFINGYPSQESQFRAAVAEVLGPGKARFFFDRLLDYFLNEDDIRYISGLGVTALRLPMNYRHFEDDARPFAYKSLGLKRLDKIVAACRKYGIYVILDLHAAQGWQNTDWHSDNPTHVAQLWNSPHFQDRVVGLWEHLARHYRKETTIAGYNLLNEPVCHVKGALRGLYDRCARAIRKADENHILFLDGNAFSKDFSEIDPNISNTVYSSHNYVTPSFSSAPYPGKYGSTYYDRGQLRREYWRGNAFMRKHKVPTWVGEFGSLYWGKPTDAGRLQSVDDMISIFEEFGHHWTIWTYKDVGVIPGWTYFRPERARVQRWCAKSCGRRSKARAGRG
jgi:endoglucanase